LTPQQTAAVLDYTRQIILDEINDQGGLAYQGSKARPSRWIRALTTYGVLLPDVDRMWSAWWSLDTLGRAIAATQYVSCLMSPENENPVFAAWASLRITVERSGLRLNACQLRHDNLVRTGRGIRIAIDVEHDLRVAKRVPVAERCGPSADRRVKGIASDC
jgi:hypothetical protein